MRTSDALLAHMAAAGPVLQRLFELGGAARADIFGDPSPALVEAVAAFRAEHLRLDRRQMTRRHCRPTEARREAGAAP